MVLDKHPLRQFIHCFPTAPFHIILGNRSPEKPSTLPRTRARLTRLGAQSNVTSLSTAPQKTEQNWRSQWLSLYFESETSEVIVSGTNGQELSLSLSLNLTGLDDAKLPSAGIPFSHFRTEWTQVGKPGNSFLCCSSGRLILLVKKTLDPADPTWS